MGLCLSTESTLASPPPPSAKVITSLGHLRLYPLPATVSLVLHREAASSPSFFLCNSDSLYYDSFIPVLDFDDHLHSNQIYFILPKSKLLRHLSAADMAAMAVMATSALASTTSFDEKSKKTLFRRYRSRISPVLVEKQRGSVWSDPVKPEVAMMEKSGSVRRIQKSASRRAKMAVRSFRLRLTTIYEGATLGKDDSRFN